VEAKDRTDRNNEEAGEVVVIRRTRTGRSSTTGGKIRDEVNNKWRPMT